MINASFDKLEKQVTRYRNAMDFVIEVHPFESEMKKWANILWNAEKYSFICFVQILWQVC